MSAGIEAGTGSDDRTARVWETRTGAQELELGGHAGPVTGAAFSPDGTRIVSRSGDQAARVWDARTGQELKGEPIPKTLSPRRLSPGGRAFAHLEGDRVVLVTVHPNAEELADRRLHTRPDPGRYRDEYESRRAAGDDFAARFYLDRLTEFYTAANRPDEAARWRPVRAAYPDVVPPRGR